MSNNKDGRGQYERMCRERGNADEYDKEYPYRDVIGEALE
jgi:hypothetical protein